MTIPSHKERIAITLSRELVERLREVAAEQHRTLSGQIAVMLERAITPRREPEPPPTSLTIPAPPIVG